jgi:hypothetical protein
MRYPAHEKLEIIRLVEESHQPFKCSLELLGIPRPTFYVKYVSYRQTLEATETNLYDMPTRKLSYILATTYMLLTKNFLSIRDSY